MSRPPMSSKRRFLAALVGGASDRVPVGNVVSIATLELMEVAGSYLPGAHLNSEAMAQLAAAGHGVLGFDTVMPVFSVVQEAAALGCEVDWGARDAMPTVRTHPFADTDDFAIGAGWTDAPSVRVALDALGLLRKSLAESVVIVGKVMGPWSLSYHLMGTESFLMNTALDPDRARRSIDALKQVTVEFAKAQMRAGADIICLADHASGAVVSPLTYRDMLLPIHQEIIAEVGCPMVLHCCGDNTDRVHHFAEAGFDSFHLESHVDLHKAVADSAGKMTLMGNINNPQVLLGGTPEAVAKACISAIGGGIDILSPECAVPLATPLRNLRTLVEVAESELDRSRQEVAYEPS